VTEPKAAPYLVDLHCHFMPPDLPDFATRFSDARWPRLVVGEDSREGRVLCGDQLFRIVQPPCWDTTERLAEMAEQQIDYHVMSPIPVGLTYWADVDPAVAYARHMNDWLAEQVGHSQGKILGLGTVPLQDEKAAIAELERAVGDLGLVGIEIGTIVNGEELSARRLRRFFHAAEEMGAPIFVHPMARYHGYDMDRCKGERESMAIEMLTDTTLAATALVFGGVLADCPGLRVMLSHGGGTFTWAYPRLRYWQSRQSENAERTAIELDGYASSLFVDSLVHDPVHLGPLMHRYGAAHIVAGSDYPFIPSRFAHPAIILDQAVKARVCTEAEANAMKGTNAFGFLGKKAGS
jgi:aminocarboxymuconate-semialdehyde decarboxylase